MLHQASAASRQVIIHLRQVEFEISQIDHVQISTIAGRDQAAIIQANPLGGRAGLTVHDVLNGNAWPPCPVADPMGQHRGGKRSITDHADMRAAILQAGQRRRAEHHLIGRIERAAGIVQEGQVEHAVAVALQHQVEGGFFW